MSCNLKKRVCCVESLESRTHLSMAPGLTSLEPNAVHATSAIEATTPVVVGTVSVSVSADSLFQNGDLTGNVTVNGTGSGKLHYYWVIKAPSGKTTRSAQLTARIVNGVADIPAYTTLPRSAIGTYSAWVHISSAGNTMDSNVVTYTTLVVPLAISITHVPKAHVWGVSLKGHVVGTYRDQYKVAVYICVNGGWWNKPYWAHPGTAIQLNGKWSCRVTTGGTDPSATEFVAYLVPKSFTVPIATGGSLPSLDFIYADSYRPSEA